MDGLSDAVLDAEKQEQAGRDKDVLPEYLRDFRPERGEA